MMCKDVATELVALYMEEVSPPHPLGSEVEAPDATE